MGKLLNKLLKLKKEPQPIEEAILNVNVASNFLREIMEKICNKHGITMSQYNVLRILKGVHPEGHPRCEIITRMIERAPDTTRLIDRLEKQQLVERDRTDDDRRKSITKITKKGINVLSKIQPQLDEMMLSIGKKITDKEAKDLSNLCEKLYYDMI